MRLNSASSIIIYLFVVLRIANFAFLLLITQGAYAQTESSSSASQVPLLPGKSATLLARNRLANELNRQVYYVVGDELVKENPGGSREKLEVYLRDSVSGILRRYYASGKIKAITPFLAVGEGLRHGVETTWSEEGIMLTRGEFYSGKEHGEFRSFFQNGKPRSYAVYDHGKFKSMECYDRYGKPAGCSMTMIPEQYPGGWSAATEELKQAVVLPSTELQARRTVRLKVYFSIDTTGTIITNQIKNLEEGRWYPRAMDEAIRAGMSKLKKFTPQIVDGWPVATQSIFGIEFNPKKSGNCTVEVLPFWNLHEQWGVNEDSRGNPARWGR